MSPLKARSSGEHRSHPSRSHAGPTGRPDPLVLAVGLIALTVYSLHGVRGNLTRDVGLYAYAGQQVADGIPPYLGVLNRAGPLAHAIPGLGAVLARLVGVDDLLGMRVLFLMIAVLCVCGVYLLARDVLHSRVSGLVAASMFLCLPGFIQHASYGPRDKTAMVLFLVLALWAMARRRWFTAGVLLGLAALVLQIALFVGGPALAVGGAPGARHLAPPAGLAGPGRRRRPAHRRGDRGLLPRGRRVRRVRPGLCPHQRPLHRSRPGDGLVAQRLGHDGEGVRRGAGPGGRRTAGTPRLRRAGPAHPGGSRRPRHRHLGRAGGRDDRRHPLDPARLRLVARCLPAAPPGRRRHRRTPPGPDRTAPAGALPWPLPPCSWWSPAPPRSSRPGTRTPGWTGSARRSGRCCARSRRMPPSSRSRPRKPLVLSGRTNPTRHQMFPPGLDAYIDDTWPGGLDGFEQDLLDEEAELIAIRRPWRGGWGTVIRPDYVKVGCAPGWTWYARRDLGPERLLPLQRAGARFCRVGSRSAR